MSSEVEEAERSAFSRANEPSQARRFVHVTATHSQERLSVEAAATAPVCRRQGLSSKQQLLALLLEAALDCKRRHTHVDDGGGLMALPPGCCHLCCHALGEREWGSVCRSLSLAYTV
jgi:hypothetical protein